MRFKVGTKVVITGGNNVFRYTKDGSEGIIKEYDKKYKQYRVEFYHLTGENSDDVISFIIPEEYLQELGDTNDPYYKINAKVRQMNARRLKNGYAF